MDINKAYEIVEDVNLDGEDVKLATISKKNGQITIKFTEDNLDYELYGFLNVFVKKLEESLYNNLEVDNSGNFD